MKHNTIDYVSFVFGNFDSSVNKYIIMF